MTISATEKSAMNSNTSWRGSSRVKDLGKKADEAAAQQRLEEEMAKAEAELKKREQNGKVESAATQQRLEEEMV